MADWPKLLIAEDDDSTLEFFSAIVRPYCYRVATATNGQEAVSKAAEFKPDCALLNFMMPKMTGLEAAVQIRQFLPDCKIVFCTGNYGNPAFHEENRRCGFDESLVIPKPFKIAELLRLLGRAGCPARPILSPDKLQSLLSDGSIVL
jgi:CheY-like chemotaxis protein